MTASNPSSNGHVFPHDGSSRNGTPRNGAPQNGEPDRQGQTSPNAPDGQTDVGAYPPTGKDSSATGPRLPVRREAAEAALTALAVTVLGVVLGLLWLWLAPRVPMVTNGEAVYLKHPEGEEAIGAEGTFVLLSLALGVIAGIGLFVCRRQGGIGLVLGLTVGGLLAAVLAWRLGVWLGPTDDLAGHAKELSAGSTFDGPLQLKAKGTLMAFPFAALAAHLLCTAIFGERDPEPPAGSGW